MITFNCPTCSQKYTVSADKAGKRSSCKRCHGLVVVPQPLPASDLPRDLPAQEERDPSKRLLVATLGAVAVITLLGVGVSFISSFWDSRPSQAAAPPPNPAPAPNREEDVRKSFDALVGRAVTMLHAQSPERLPSAVQNDLDLRTGTDVRIDSTIAPSWLIDSSHDLQRTESVMAPYRGVFRFGARMEGTISGVQRGEGLRGSGGGEYPFSFVFRRDEIVAATYTLRDSRWSLEEVTFTTRNIDAELPSTNIFAQMMASQLNSSRSRMVGRVHRSPAASDLSMIRGLRDAARE